MKSIYINANCQGPALKGMLDEALPDWRIESLAVHKTYERQELDDAAAFMRSADFVLSQPIANNYQTPEFRSVSVREYSRQEPIWFPSVYFTGQQITLCALKKDGVRIDAPGWAYHDCIIAALVVDGLDDQAIIRRVRSVDLFEREQVLNRVESILDANAKREAQLGCDIRLTNLFRSEIGQRSICHSFNHPERFVLARVCNEFLARIGVTARVSEDGPDILRFPHHPLMPSVAYHLGSIYEREDFRCHFASKSLSFDEYVTGMAKAFRTVDPAHLRAAIDQTPDAADIVHPWEQEKVA